MYRIKEFIKNSYLKKIYEIMKAIRDKRIRRKRLKGSYQFINRRIDSKVMCMVLAGYKDFLWPKVFNRIKKYLPENVDVCVVSSGLYSEKLNDICQENQWSYLSVERNCVTLAQNIAIDLHKNAEMIYKIDEDIFVTKNFFKVLMDTYIDANNGLYEVGFIAPLIPINGYGHVRVLEKLNSVEEYEYKFEKVKYASRPDRKIENDPEVAKYFWGNGNRVDRIDQLDDKFSKMPNEFHACPIRFSIGAILFPRETWEKMGMFIVKSGPCMAVDEIQINNYCMIESKPIIVTENTCVGHLSFGTQNQVMKRYFIEHNDLF